MIAILPAFYISSTLQVGAIYKFEASELINTKIPHYFIVIAIDEDNNYMVLCTSQKENKEKHFKNNNLDFNGLVYLKPDKDNCLKMDTYVNCNDYHTISTPDLIKKVSSGNFEYIGKINLNHYSQIITGINNSYVSDFPKFLLIDSDQYQ